MECHSHERKTDMTGGGEVSETVKWPKGLPHGHDMEITETFEFEKTRDENGNFQFKAKIIKCEVVTYPSPGLKKEEEK
jgi:hypothetical protein